ncbi:MAG: hypothetical protein D6731_08910 [Planctomycetota bacterium]|nr:MAG: hypothetical protein D6731_08910 [Planctomycetota bacterium]
MLFVANYEVTWEALETAVAKRLEWNEAKPDSFRYVGEWVWHEGDPPFRGVAVVEVGSVEDLNAWVLHYGETLSLRIRPATDVVSGIASLGALGGA